MAEIWGAALGAIGAIGGGLISANGAKDAAKGQNAAAGAATAEQARQFDITQQNQAPYREAGVAALGTLGTLAPQYGKAPTAEEVMATPGYQFGLTQGRNALEGSAAASGGLYSGQTGKDLVQYGNDYGTTKYDDAFNRNRLQEGDTWNRYASLAGIGQTATNQLQSAGQNYANNVGNIAMGNANAQGAASIAQGNIWGNVFNQAGSGAKSWFQTPSAATNVGNANMPGTVNSGYYPLSYWTGG